MSNDQYIIDLLKQQNDKAFEVIFETRKIDPNVRR